MHAKSHLIAIAVAFAALMRFASESRAADTDVPGVGARIAFARQYDGVLHVGILLDNSGKKDAQSHQAIDYSQVVLVDHSANKKRFALKDANGHYLAGPVSDWNGGGRWFPKLAGESQTTVWILFDAVAPGSHLSVQAPVIGSFDDVAVTEGPGSAVAEVPASLPPLHATLESATRADAQLHVRLKVSNPGKTAVHGAALEYRDAYALDPKGKRAYPLLKGSDGQYLAEPKADANDGGRWFLSKVAPGGQAIMSLTFQAPPDSVRSVDVILPQFGPFEAVAITGAGGAADSGVAVAGKSVDLERALKDLNADVSAAEIKIDLAADLLFDFDKADLKPAALPQLEKLAVVMKSYPGARVRIDGHTDGKGDDAYNQKLSERRAQTVVRWLVEHSGANPANLAARGFGKSKPVAPNTHPDGSDDPEGRARNRRVEITIARG